MSAEEYRRRASEFFQHAETASNIGARTWLLEMARSWLLLAEQAEKNLTTDLVYETPPAPQRVAQQQQQQQIQPKSEDETAAPPRPRSARAARRPR
jgi:hypothetical protein